jgi:hypothetical protein
MHSQIVSDAALGLAAEGYSVFPCRHRTKEPAIRRGFYSATTNPATIRRWFGGTQEYNVAVRTGMASGVWILDIDEGGAASLRRLEDEHGELPPTRTSLTTKGMHLWWRTDSPIPCSASRIAPGIDVRGDGGYAMAPPSIHPSGKRYEWLSIEPPAVAPDWLVALTRKPPPPPIDIPCKTFMGSPGAYGAAALDREIEALASTSPGSRNNALNLVSFRLHQLVAGGELDAGDVEQGLIAASHANGLMTDPKDGPRKVLATIRSGARAGLLHPRSRQAR